MNISFGQKYVMNHISVEQGLAQSQVFNILQDKDGFVWVSTLGGVSKVNGESIENFSMRDGLNSNLITNGLCDSEGTLWFCSNGAGISRYKDGKFITFKISDQHIDNEVRSIFELEKGSYLVGTIKGGAYLFDGESFERFVPAVNDSDIIANNYGLIQTTRAPDGTLWLATNKGVISIKGEKTHFYKEELIALSKKDKARKAVLTVAIYAADNGEVVFGTYDGLVFLKDGKLSKFTIKDGLPHNSIRAIERAADGTYWIGTSYGASRFRNGRFTNFTEENGFAKVVRNIYIDNEDNVWIGTDGKGIYQFTNQTFSLTNEEYGLPGNITVSIFEDSKGTIWYGTYGKGLAKYEDGKYSKLNIGGKVVWSIAEDHDGVVWFAGDNGVLSYANGKWKTYKEAQGIDDLECRSVFVDKDNVKWIGVKRKDFLYKIINGKVSKFPLSMEMEEVYSFVQDDKDNIWFSSDGDGLGLIKNGKFFDFSVDDGLLTQETMTLAMDKYNNILVGCNGGGIASVKMLDNNEVEIKTIVTVDEFEDDGVISLFFDSKDILWVGTNRGIVRMDYYKFLEKGELDLKHYGYEEGFIGIECIQNAIIEDHEGIIHVGTINGVMHYDRTYDKVNDVTPKLLLTDLQLFYADVDWKQFVDSTDIIKNIPQGLELPYDQNHVTINYAGVSYKAPTKVRYRYRLEGLDNQWSPELKYTEVSVSYPGLPHGEYRFMLMACNNDGIWTKKPLVFEFEIRPPFWKTPWFIILSILAGIVGAYLAIKYRFKQIQERSKILEATVKVRTQELEKEKELVESQNEILAEQRDEIEHKSEELEKAFSDITDSIKYAQKIQDAILTSKSFLKSAAGDYFILFKPKAIVSGDFYWVHEFPDENKVLVAAADCTGHGVPGAFMSMIGNSLLNELVIDKGILEVDEILNIMRDRIISALSQTGEAGEARDGMDIALCLFDKDNKTIEFAGAFNPVYIIDQNGELSEVKGDPQPVGFFYEDQDKFTKKVIDVSEASMMVVFSDGYADQFGGPRGKKLKYKKFKEILLENHEKPMQEIHDKLDEVIEDWRGYDSPYGGKYEQIDDILVMGLKLN